MNLDFAQVVPALPFILQGALVTLQYTSVSILFGFIFGVLLTLCKLSGILWLRWFANFYTSIFRGTPLLVQLSLIYFATPQLTGYRISAFEAGILTLSLNSAAYISEIIRAGVQAVDKGQMEAALSLGISYPLIMKDIIFPQAIKNILPALVNEAIDLLKESALVSVIGGMDLLRRANIVSAEKFIYFEPLLVVSLIYYILVMGLTGIAKWLEFRMRYSD